MKISIIIPVYNAEKYLKRCVNSVLTSLKNTDGEILLIDNNSKDNSLKLIKQLAKENAKIRAEQCKIQGAAAVRNYGARLAKGDYIWFIDADDYISEDAISKLLNLAKQKSADIVMFGAERETPSGEKSYMSAVDMNDTNYKSRFVRYGMGPWQLLIKRAWWKQNNLSFKEGIIHEDMELMSSLILYTDNYTSIDEPLYHYFYNPDSVLHKKSFNPNIFDIFPALEGLYTRFKEAKAAKKYHDELEWFFIWNLLIDSARDFAQFKEGRPGFAQSRALLKKYFPNWRKNKFFKQRSLRSKIKILYNYLRNR